ncbi:sensor histidine kinase [Oceanirhabdus sp. W0125-5]|uniref:sensor histidine kinase n=1 Tax=Oceanirhabdus sp. W0125-5 TaxID=2999116 RepID=UPI0022F2D85B|nr:sensor histidine kinase [Oceanirhabdus sp. W0125-5]WBW98629.1 sensor histidine kinase [Oceanirhabdus sp. W0125-5]
MNKRIIVDFIKDKMSIIILYMINTLSIIFFYTLITGYSKEIVYPLILALFFLGSFLIVEGYKYYQFNISIENIRNQQGFSDIKIRVRSKEHKRIISLLKDKQRKLSERLCAKESIYEEKIALLSQWMHKLKNNISVILMIAQENVLKEPENQNEFKNIENEAMVLHTSVGQALEFIRLGSFEQDFELAEIELIGSVKSCINKMKSQFLYNNVFPVMSENEKEFKVISDKRWNEVLIEQIISNAIKYSGGKSKDINKGKKIYFKVWCEEKYTYLSIKDEGIGIPEYDKDRVFRPFFTGHNGRKVRNSTGIGLYICKEISSKLGHEIKIESQVDEGTEVRMRYLSKL